MTRRPGPAAPRPIRDARDYRSPPPFGLANDLTLIAILVKNERPLQFFGLIGLIFIAIGFVSAAPQAETYLETGLAPRLPTAVLIVGLVIVGVLSIFAGLILDIVTTMRQEAKRLAYLAQPPPGANLLPLRGGG